MKLSNLEKIISLRRALHQHPELSMQEKETMKILQNFHCLSFLHGEFRVLVEGVTQLCDRR